MKYYLAGAMANCTDQQMFVWRDHAKSVLGTAHCFDPSLRDYRGKSYWSLYNNIVEQDLDEIRRSDIIIANVEHPSVGTMMEIRGAYDDGKIVLIACDEANPSPWLIYYSHMIYRKLDHLLDHLVNLQAIYGNDTSELKDRFLSIKDLRVKNGST